MADRTADRRRSPRTLLAVVSAILVVAVLATLAVVSQGYDAQQVPKLETSVWVARDAGQYARVNTDLGEIDTVRTVDSPSNVLQSGSQGVVFTQADRQLWPVSAANPVNLVPPASTTTSTAKSPSGAAAKNTPAGTRAIASAGNYVAYLTDVGKVSFATLATDAGSPNDAATTSPVDPFARATAKTAKNYVANAVAVSADGQIAVYSAAEGAVRRFDAKSDVFVGSATKIASPPPASAKVELALVMGTWVLSASAQKSIWIDGHSGPIKTGLGTDARLQASSATGDRVYLADSRELVAAQLASGVVTRVAKGGGTPAVPTVVASVVYAAWLSASSGILWSSATAKSIVLKNDGDALSRVKSIVPVFRSNGDRAVLSEQSSGMLWTVPDGKLIPLTQWSLDDQQQHAGSVPVDDVAEEVPPVAVADSFGVRSGGLVVLPVLLNDYDPNKKDVLSIVPASIAGGLSDPAFGDLHLVSNDQEAVVNVRAESGTATFSYSVTDGTDVSPPATVTLTVIPNSTNTGPVWCGVESCVQKWPTPQISPGGTITVDVLTGWVDPQGDPIVLSDARKNNPDDPVAVVPKADGTIAIRHTDPNANNTVIPITVTVSDSFGATTTKVLNLTVTGSPALVVSPVALVAGANQEITLKIADHVSGGSGSYRLLDASSPTAGASGLEVVPNTAAGQIGLTANAPGEYALTYSVQDVQTQAEQAAVVRLTVLASSTPLTVAPLTAFVRANEDTTVDVIGAVQNTTGRVLIVSSATTPTAGLSASVVGESSVRVSGTTPNGLPGRVGTVAVTIVDGAGALVVGSLTVFLVAPSTEVGPIAEPDTATVRAGGQVDIPVLANDVSPRGERLVLSTTVKGSGAPGELAFVAGGVVRYLAPSKPGVYALQYSVYLENLPSRLDTTTITVTVMPAGTNRAPIPPILTARVLNGQKVTVPFNSYGVDPDGDAVVLSAVAQPKSGQGTSSISADGGSIVYVAPALGIPSGQVTFEYTMRNSQGTSGTGIVNVGVLTTKTADTAPITYSDYVRIQKNATSPVTLEPLLIDVDPAQGKLTMVSLVPNAPNSAGNPEYARLLGLIDSSTSLKNGTVVLHAGDVLGTHSYVYTVQSSASSSTSQGLVVVTVSETAAADHPEVSDTVLTARNRGELDTGIDVVSGKVSWPTGNVSGLTLSVWGDAASRYNVSGTRISGKLPTNGDIVPFSLTGADPAGAKVVSYGFLRIPALNDMRLQLVSTIKPISVPEDKSVEINVGDLIDLAPSDSTEIRHDASFSVQRANASCVPGTATRANYAAGREAPWTDSCTIPVRIVGQTDWTLLAIPITIVPNNPQAQLNSVTRTIAPGASDTVLLYDAMTTWEGGRVGNKALLSYLTSHLGSAFIVAQQGTTVTIDARADAVPGTRENVQVSVPNYGGLEGNIALVVGAAAPDVPRGATFTSQCDVSHGPSCSVRVIGLPGEYDPFAGKAGAGLHLASVGSIGSVNCTVATVVAAGDTQVTASWPSSSKPAGGQCVVPFTVKDAQGRLGQGQLTIDVQGYPPKPSSITNVVYNPTSVTVLVSLGDAGLAHPALTGVAIYENGSPVSSGCSATTGGYRCDISALENGVNHVYTARAVNSIGESLDTTALSTHAYASPAIAGVTATSYYKDQTTTTTNGAVKVMISAGSDVLSFHINETNQDFPRTGDVTIVDPLVLPTSATRITVVPTSRFTPPPGDPGAAETAATNGSAVVLVIGTPSYTGTPSVKPTSEDAISVSGVSMNLNNSTQPEQTTYLAWYADNAAAEPTCSDDTATGGVIISATPADTGGRSDVNSGVINKLTKYRTYSVKACGSNGFGSAHSSVFTFFFAGTMPAPAPAVGNTYTVAHSDADQTGDTSTYELESNTAAAGAPAGFQTYFIVDGAPKALALKLSEAVATPDVKVEYCNISHSDFCSTAVAMGPAQKSPPTIVTVTFNPAKGDCVDAGSTDQITISSGARGSATVSFAPSPSGSSEIVYHVTWVAPFSSMETRDFTQKICAITPSKGPGV